MLIYYKKNALIEKDHVGDWNPEKDSEDGFRTGCRNASH